MAALADAVVDLSRDLCERVDRLRFAGSVTHVYNPLRYARAAHEQYLRLAARPSTALLLGMNPGPWGMAQTGVPFGEVATVRDWLAIDGTIERPPLEHPKRPVLGYECRRSEVSGARLWGWAQERFVTPAAFFARFFVWNYCPLSFMVESGANLTPDKLPAHERKPLFEVCDRALAALVALAEPTMIIGIGKFAEARARAALPQTTQIGCILHPSPASPAANRGWSLAAQAQLEELGVL